MNASDQASNPTSNWQAERAKTLQRACLSIRAAIQRGEPIGRSIHRVAKCYHGRPFKSDPARCLALSSKTLRRHWDLWRRNGELPAAFKLKSSARPSAMKAHVLIRFVNFCAAARHKSMRAAWLEFSSRPGFVGQPGEKNCRMPNYDMARRGFPVADFRFMQGRLKAIQSAQIDLAKMRLGLETLIRERQSDQASRRRIHQRSDYQI